MKNKTVKKRIVHHKGMVRKNRQLNGYHYYGGDYMPTVFLSPSAQEFNPYAGGGNEEYYMNLVTDALIPYLEASGIVYSRNNPERPFTDAVRLSNEGEYDLHLALHSNAAGAGNAGSVRGSQVYYYPGSTKGQRAADIFANNMKEIYPIPDLVRTVPTTTLGEIIRTKAPAILIEVAYHDNTEDADWIRDNISEIAENLAMSVGDFLGVEIVMPFDEPSGLVRTQGGNLNIRAQPTVNSDIKGKIPNGTRIPLLSEQGGWYLTRYAGVTGYVSGEYIT